MIVKFFKAALLNISPITHTILPYDGCTRGVDCPNIAGKRQTMTVLIDQFAPVNGELSLTKLKIYDPHSTDDDDTLYCVEFPAQAKWNP